MQVLLFILLIVILILLFNQLYWLLDKEKENARQKRSTFNYYSVNDSTLSKLYIDFNDKVNILEKCNVDNPKCTNPIASCVYMDHAFKLVKNTILEKYSANQNVNEGYCLNLLKSNYNAKRNISEKTLKSCNPNTGERVVFKSGAHGFKIGCMCKHPDIITQDLPLNSDCNIPIACGNGKLSGANWQNPKIKVDIINDLHCKDCPNDAISDRNLLTNQPICRERSFAEKNIDDSKQIYPLNFPLLQLNHPAIEPEFANKFLHPEKRHVPNPCGFDFFTKQPFRENECALEKTLDEKIYFCKSNNINVVTIQSDDDYLRGNAGKWANGCFKFTESIKNIDYAVAEFYNRPAMIKGSVPHPIIGYALNSSKLSSSAFRILKINEIE